MTRDDNRQTSWSAIFTNGMRLPRPMTAQSVNRNRHWSCRTSGTRPFGAIAGQALVERSPAAVATDLPPGDGPRWGRDVHRSRPRRDIGRDRANERRRDSPPMTLNLNSLRINARAGAGRAISPHFPQQRDALHGGRCPPRFFLPNVCGGGCGMTPREPDRQLTGVNRRTMGGSVRNACGS